MHPHQHIFFHRGPSRIFWFLVGAGVATWWHHSSIMRDHRAQYFPCVVSQRRVQDSSGGTPTQDWKSSSGLNRTPGQQRDWEQDKEHLWHLQKRAGETVADISESTLDSIISGAETLKTKLTELRAERERFEAEKKAAQMDA